MVLHQGREGSCGCVHVCEWEERVGIVRYIPVHVQVFAQVHVCTWELEYLNYHNHMNMHTHIDS